MKNLILITFFSLAFVGQSCAQKVDQKNVPEKVVSAFQQKFPGAKKVDWDMEDETEWEAEFDLDGKEYSANFSSAGEWLETELEIKKSEIPADMLTILNQNFTDYEIEEAEVVETPAGKSYEFEVEVGEKDFEVSIDANGQLTKKQKDEKDED